MHLLFARPGVVKFLASIINDPPMRSLVLLVCSSLFGDSFVSDICVWVSYIA